MQFTHQSGIAMSSCLMHPAASASAAQQLGLPGERCTRDLQNFKPPDGCLQGHPSRAYGLVCSQRSLFGPARHRGFLAEPAQEGKGACTQGCS